MDDFNRAEKQYEKNNLTSEIEGFFLIGNKFKDILKNNDLEEILTKQGDEFDSEKHEAISQLPVNSKEKKGKIIDKGTCEQIIKKHGRNDLEQTFLNLARGKDEL